MPLVSARRYAEHRGVSHTAVQKAIRQGRVLPTADGKIDVAQADRDWARNTSSISAPRLVRTTDAQLGQPASGPSYAQSRAFREAYLARMAKLEFEERSGTLLRRDEVESEMSSMVRTARDRLLNIADRFAPILAVEMNERRVHQILKDEIRKTLIELSNYYSRESDAEENQA